MKLVRPCMWCPCHSIYDCLIIVPSLIVKGVSFYMCMNRTVTNYMSVSAPSAPPGNVTVLTESTQLIVRWEPPSTSDWNGIIRRYYIIVNESNTGIALQVTSISQIAIVSNLKPSTSYRVQVAAYTLALGPFSPVVEIDTLPNG